MVYLVYYYNIVASVAVYKYHLDLQLAAGTDSIVFDYGIIVT